MAGVRETYRRLKRLRDDLPTIAEKTVSGLKEEISQVQKDQLKHGVNAAGGSFRKYRNKAYADKKHEMNPLAGYGNPDLRYTGSFYDGVYVTVSGGKVSIGSHDEKAQMLEADYEGVFGISPQEMEDFLYGRVKPAYQQNILDSLKQ